MPVDPKEREIGVILSARLDPHWEAGHYWLASLARRNVFSQAEVGEHEVPIVAEENVVWLNVAVDDTGFV